MGIKQATKKMVSTLTMQQVKNGDNAVECGLSFHNKGHHDHPTSTVSASTHGRTRGVTRRCVAGMALAIALVGLAPTASAQGADTPQVATGFTYARGERLNGNGFGGEFAHFFSDVAGITVGAAWSAADVPVFDATAFSIGVGPRFRMRSDKRVVPSIAVTAGVSRATLRGFGVSVSSLATTVSAGFAIDVRLSDRVAIRAIEPSFGASFANGQTATGLGFSSGLVFSLR